MQCPKCSYNLSGCSGNTCPECGTPIALVAAPPLRFQTRLLYAGIGLILIYCMAQTVWFWSETNTFNRLVMTGGRPDPGKLAADTRIGLWATYISNLSLAAGLACVAISISQLYRRVVWLLATNNKPTE